jgi:hypothetical protein
MRLARTLVFTLVLLGLSACSTPETPTPVPQASYAGTTPAYDGWVRNQVKTYWEHEPGNGIIPLVFPLADALTQAEEGQIELIISASAPPAGWFATPLKKDAIAVIIHQDLGVRDLSREDLFDIFFGREENWSAFIDEDLPIQPIIPLEGDEIRTAFEGEVLHGAGFTSNALLAPHPRAALELAREIPGSIALVPWSSLEDETPIRIDGVRPIASAVESGGYPLSLDLNAYAPEEPDGRMRAFLGWLQARLLAGP